MALGESKEYLGVQRALSEVYPVYMGLEGIGSTTRGGDKKRSSTVGTVRI
jgi:hypothetical protein